MLYLEISKKVNRRKQRLMAPDFVYFYVFAFLMISSALGIIFAPRMYLSLLSLFFLVVFSSLLYLGLNAVYLSVFQFILCGLCLFVYVFLLLKKLELKACKTCKNRYEFFLYSFVRNMRLYLFYKRIFKFSF